MLPLLVAQIPSIDFGDDVVTHKGTRLLALGVAQGSTHVGLATCTRAVYIGANSRIYVEGPRSSMGKAVVDIHPYNLEDSLGWGGLGLNQITDMMAAFFI